uniref:6-phosphofructokinase n=1 Tax=uncultured marine microorganism HF4000_APKG7H23 TaxID=455551 RepID=B3T9T1_9ZZZZ|nr:putative phosphofructokinase [uncultured marine microorganism HF4000_APKG7H23]
MQAIAVLTSGGDAPGMNACIRAVTRAALHRGATAWGVQDGFDGLVHQRMEPLTSRGVAGILQRGGSILGAGRCEEFFHDTVRRQCLAFLREQGVEGLVVIGGDGSLQAAQEIHKLGFPVITVPGTIDNDMPGTDRTIGAYTAVNTAMEAIDRLRDTASAHHRAMIVEVMGRNSGYIAVRSGLAAGAELIITPERPISLDEVFQEMEKVERLGKRHFVVVLAEGAQWDAAELTRLINTAENAYEARYTVLGYTQRGGSPTALDRILATRMGVAAVDALWEGMSDMLVCWREGQIVVLPVDRLPPRSDPWADQMDRVFEITDT